jgi:hypothetical protein
MFSDPTIRRALAHTAHTDVADLLLHLHEWIRPERWERWLMTYGFAELSSKDLFPYHGLDSFGAPMLCVGSAATLKSAARLAFAELN